MSDAGSARRTRTRTGPRFTPLLESLPATVPFVGPETQERTLGQPFIARLGANENVFGPSPAAVKAMADAAADVWKYGDPENHALKQLLAERHAVSPANIVVGEGIDGMLGYLVRMLISKGTPVVTSLGGYPTFNYHVAGYGGMLHTVPYRDDAEDPEALLAAVRRIGAPLVYLANPDNPMGTCHPAAAVQAMIDDLPDRCLLCLDEAYIDFAPRGTAPPVEPDNPQVIRFRTFSKAYGMAGARIGYAIAEAGLAAAFNKIRNHFGVGAVAQAGARAALGDPGHLARVVSKVARARRRIETIAAASGLDTVASAANFVAVDCGRDGAFARAVVQSLAVRRVFVRMPLVAPQDRCIRVTAGLDHELDALAERLPGALSAAAAHCATLASPGGC